MTAITRLRKAFTNGNSAMHEPAAELPLGTEVGEYWQPERSLQAELLESVSDAVISTDVDFNIISWNRAAETVYGWLGDEVIGKPVAEVTRLVYPYHQQQDVLDHFFEHGSWQGEVIQARKDGATIHVLASVSLMCDDQGNPTGAVAVNRDITERKRAEEALREERSRAGQYLDLAGSMFVGIDAQGDVNLINRRGCEILGCTRQDIIGRNWFDNFVPEECRDDVRSVFQGLLDGEIVPAERTENAVLTGDRQERMIAWHSTILRNDAGDIMGTLSAGEEISGRAQAEEALRESEERYRMLFDRVPVGLYRTTPEGDILDANPALVQMLGYPDLQSLLAVKATDLYEYPERRVRVQALTEQGEILRGHELQIRRLDGTTIWVRDTARVIRDPDGQIAYYEGSLENISKRRQTDELLQGLNLAALGMETALTDEEVFTAAGEELKNLGFTSAVLLKDESGSRLVLRYLGTESRTLEAAERLVGISYRGISFPIDAVPRQRGAMLGKAIFGEWDLESVRQALPVAAKPLAGQIQKLMALSRAITVPLIVEDEVIGLLSVQSNDLTQENVPAITAFANQMAAALRKANLFRELQDSLEKLQRTQAQLLQSQKMEAVGTLAGGVAHDFNNILTAIAGFGQLVRDELAPDDARRVDVEEILKASERAASLTRQLLAFSRRQRLQMQILDLNELVANTEKMLRRLIGEDIHLTTVLEERLARVRADPGQMEQVIMNLAVNAHDAMPSGGQLVIKTENVALDRAQSSLIPEARPGQFVRLTVSDTGMGMDEETLKHAFEPFFTTKGPGKGTGLGLPVVYGIAAQHEGWVNILTGVGEGSTFEIYLPAFPLESEGEPEDEDQPEPLGEGQRILLVEDDAGVRGVAARVLRQGGYTVLEASTMEEAVQVFEQQQGKIDLLFSDVVLPSSNGLELADQLLSRKADLRVLLASGYAGDKSRWAAIVERGFAFIQKPYLVPELLRAVAEALDDGVATG